MDGKMALAQGRELPTLVTYPNCWEQLLRPQVTPVLRVMFTGCLGTISSVRCPSGTIDQLSAHDGETSPRLVRDKPEDLGPAPRRTVT